MLESLLELEGPGRRLNHANLPARHLRALDKLKSLGIAPPPEMTPHNCITMEAGLHGDRIAMQRWQHEARLASAVQDPPHATRPRRNSNPLSPPTLRLPRPLPLDHVSDLYFGFNKPIGIGPVKHGLAPLSYLGPSGTSIVALSNHQCNIVSIVAQLHTGSQALRRFPWRPRTSTRLEAQAEPRTGTGIPGDDDEFSDTDTEASASSDEDDAERDTETGSHDSDTDTVASSCSSEVETIRDTDSYRPTDTDSETCPMDTDDEYTGSSNRSSDSGRIRRKHPARNGPHGPLISRQFPPVDSEFRSAAQVCRFCGRGQEHPIHAFFECSADRLVTLRTALLADAAVAWDRLLTKIEEAYESTYRDVLPDATETRSELITAYSDAAGDTSEAYWLTYRLLWAIPWSARDVPPSARAATLLGATFDEVILSRHASRPLADSWVAWSSKWTRRFGAAWADLLVAARGAPPSGQ